MGVTHIQVTEKGNCEKTIYFCTWLLQAIHDGALDPQLTFFIHKAWFQLSGYINTQNNRYWSSINPRQTSDTPHDQKIGVWCAITVTQIAGSIFLKHKFKSRRDIFCSHAVIVSSF
jgi:hypothetical protein